MVRDQGQRSGDQEGGSDEPKDYLGRILIGFVVLAAILWILSVIV
jgi:hypothetical protein